MSDPHFLFPDAVQRPPVVMEVTPLNKPLSVLDHGYVKYVGHMGSDETVVEAARMSTGKGFQGWESDAKLLEYLYKNQHHTPFEMCELAIEVKAPLFVFREWHRHRTQSYNEMSARYVQMPNEHYVPEAGRFAPKQTGNKQTDSEISALGELSDSKFWRSSVLAEQDTGYQYYEKMLKHGVPREVARINTPVSRYSVMRAKTDLRNWLAFLKLRDHSAAQWEMQQYAAAVAEIVRALWPRTYALYEEHTKHAVTLSRSEVNEMKDLLKGERAMPRETAGIDFPLSEGFLAKFK